MFTIQNLAITLMVVILVMLAGYAAYSSLADRQNAKQAKAQ